MTRKTITIPDAMEDWIKAQIESGRYGNDSEYIRDLHQPFGTDLVLDEPSLTLLAHQTRLAQHGKMLGHRELADRHALTKSADVHASGRQLVEDGATGWIGERLEDGVFDHANR